jgi:pantoate--beta-alanine ligase
MQVADSIESIRELRKNLSGTVGLVPTMGALHAGHLSLVEEARKDNDVVIVSIFVNPTQFAPNEDFSAYPRDLPSDLQKLRQAGVDVVFTPTPEMMYGTNYQTYVQVEGVSQGLEGEYRSGHFRGVATVVSKLFNLIQPDTAYFGQKDAQQVAVIRRMVRDLNFPLQIAVCPITRETDGLAMSSRNAYLTQEQREAASVLYRAIQKAGAAYERGERHPDILCQIALELLQSEPLAQIEYVSANDPKTLAARHDATEQPILLSMVVKFGKTRLLDNIILPLHLNNRAGLTETLGNN